MGISAFQARRNLQLAAATNRAGSGSIANPDGTKTKFKLSVPVSSYSREGVTAAVKVGVTYTEPVVDGDVTTNDKGTLSGDKAVQWYMLAVNGSAEVPDPAPKGNGRHVAGPAPAEKESATAGK